MWCGERSIVVINTFTVFLQVKLVFMKEASLGAFENESWIYPLNINSAGLHRTWSPTYVAKHWQVRRHTSSVSLPCDVHLCKFSMTKYFSLWPLCHIQSNHSGVCYRTHYTGVSAVQNLKSAKCECDLAYNIFFVEATGISMILLLVFIFMYFLFPCFSLLFLAFCFQCNYFRLGFYSG